MVLNLFWIIIAFGALCVVGSAVFSLTKPLIVGNAVNVLQTDFERSDLIIYGLLFVAAATIFPERSIPVR